MSDDDEEIFDCMGRINLPDPADEALARAAEDCLGPDADEALLTDGGKVFRGQGAPGAFFLQGPDEEAGTILAAAKPELKAQLMQEAAKVRAFQADVDRAPYLVPRTNPMIKTED